MNFKIQDNSDCTASTCLTSMSVDLTQANESDDSADGLVQAQIVESVQKPKAIRSFQAQRFAIGLLCTTSGVALILGIGFRMIETRDIGGDFTMPLVGICVMLGVVLMGGGFGVMATSSSGFDEEEFDRLAAAGNISAVSQPDQNADDFGQDAHQTAA